MEGWRLDPFTYLSRLPRCRARSDAGAHHQFDHTRLCEFELDISRHIAKSVNTDIWSFFMVLRRKDGYRISRFSSEAGEHVENDGLAGDMVYIRGSSHLCRHMWNPGSRESAQTNDRPRLENGVDEF